MNTDIISSRPTAPVRSNCGKSSSAHAFIGQIIVPPIDSPLKQATLRLGNLTAHFERLQARLYTSTA